MRSERGRLRKEERGTSLVGPQVFDLVTCAMYDQPLTMYREYIQNSVDSLMTTKSPGDGVIEVTVDPVTREVTIRDNGPGMSYEDACRALLPIGKSTKRRGQDLGFRGVGRLAGLAFAETVTFTTRTGNESAVTVVTWNGSRVRERVRETGRVDRAIHDCVDVTRIAGDTEAPQFFEVKVTGIHRFVAGTVLNTDAVRTYISEVCPVPISAAFPFEADLDQLFADVGLPTSVSIYIRGDEAPIVRPFGEDIALSTSRRDRYTGLEVVRVPALDRRTGLAAVGWIAHSSYLGAIPKRAAIRGIRARIGNIQIGDEAVFDHLFTQARFNRWCIGEVHIVDPQLVPNGRRDYFEIGPHTRNLENHLSAVCRRVMAQCRRSSRQRNAARKVVADLTELEAIYALASSGYLRARDAKSLVDKARRMIPAVRQKSGLGEAGECLGPRIDKLEEKLNGSDKVERCEELGDLPAAAADAYREVFGAVASVAKTGDEAMRTIQAIVGRLRVSVNDRGEEGLGGAKSRTSRTLATVEAGRSAPSSDVVGSGADVTGHVRDQHGTLGT